MPSGFLTVLISLLFFACLAALGAAGERAPERVRIAVSSKSLGFLDTWAAEKRGFYRKYGLDAEIIANARPLAEPVKTVLDPQGKPDPALDRVVDPTIIDEVLRERR
jgi:ABC-type nitrate/sulfonate/bicarbonate transport system substrate-binding protein